MLLGQPPQKAPIVHLLVFDDGGLKSGEGAHRHFFGEPGGNALVQNALHHFGHFLFAGGDRLPAAHQIAQSVNARHMDAGCAVVGEFHGIIVHIAVKDLFFLHIAAFDHDLGPGHEHFVPLFQPAAALVVVLGFQGEGAAAGFAVCRDLHFQLGDAHFVVGHCLAADGQFKSGR